MVQQAPLLESLESGFEIDVIDPGELQQLQVVEGLEPLVRDLLPCQEGGNDLGRAAWRV